MAQYYKNRYNKLFAMNIKRDLLLKGLYSKLTF